MVTPPSNLAFQSHVLFSLSLSLSFSISSFNSASPSEASQAKPGFYPTRLTPQQHALIIIAAASQAKRRWEEAHGMAFLFKYILMSLSLAMAKKQVLVRSLHFNPFKTAPLSPRSMFSTMMSFWFSYEAHNHGLIDCPISSSSALYNHNHWLLKWRTQAHESNIRYAPR